MVWKHIAGYVAKTIYAFVEKNDLRTPSGKFLRVESCHLESSDFLGLWVEQEEREEVAASNFVQVVTIQINISMNDERAGCLRHQQ